MIKFIISLCIIYVGFFTQAKEQDKAAPKYNNFISPSSKSYYIQHESEQIYQVKLLKTPQELAKGFSGIKPEQVGNHQGLFFYFPTTSERHFWMPDTYFDLTIIYLNENLKVLHLIERAPHHEGTSEVEQPIFRAKPIKARFVLEVKAGISTPNSIKVGDQFKWIKHHPPGFPQK